MKLSLTWWNTGLSPLGKDRASEDDETLVTETVKLFTETLGIDFLALGEVNERNIKNIEKNLDNYEIISGYEKVGRSTFDTCIIFNPNTLRVENQSNIVAEKGNRSYRIAQKFDLVVVADGTILNAFISHWPSRLTLQQGNAERSYYGMTLRDSVNEVYSTLNEEAFIVLMGDYNDEPFDHSLTEHLMATRDRSLAKKNRHLLYNPFWRKLGQRNPYSHTESEELIEAGTCFYKSEPYSRWKTFDQMIFSSSFLGNSNWHLNEAQTATISPEWYLTKIFDAKSTFDHLPIYSEIEKVN